MGVDELRDVRQSAIILFKRARVRQSSRLEHSSYLPP